MDRGVFRFAINFQKSGHTVGYNQRMIKYDFSLVSWMLKERKK